MTKSDVKKIVSLGLEALPISNSLQTASHSIAGYLRKCANQLEEQLSLRQTKENTSATQDKIDKSNQIIREITEVSNSLQNLANGIELPASVKTLFIFVRKSEQIKKFVSDEEIKITPENIINEVNNFIKKHRDQLAEIPGIKIGNNMSPEKAAPEYVDQFQRIIHEGNRRFESAGKNDPDAIPGKFATKARKNSSHTGKNGKGK